MPRKMGRNDPCHCGSGRKYKHCHGRPAKRSPEDDPEKGVAVALGWLEQRHRKALKAELQSLTLEAFWPAEDPDPAEVPGEYWEMIGVNVQEWLLASGELTVKGKRVPVHQLILGPGGPRLGPRQQDYLRQLATRPLRLYEVTESRPGDGLTLVDVIDDDAEPVRVQERTASEVLKAGDLLGTRVMEVGDHFELSGALYPFTDLHARSLRAILSDFLRDMRDENLPEDEFAFEFGHLIVEHWFEQMTLPPTMPQFMDASTGEPLMLTTDYFRILDREALVEKLTACAELEQEDESHWAWIEEGSDGQLRARVSLSIEPPSSDHIELFYRTARLADEGCAWFENLAGDSVEHLQREETDPLDLMDDDDDDMSPVGLIDDLPDISPEQMTRIVQDAMNSAYTSWADEPLPALDERTPREAIATSRGLERVKGLLRSYEEADVELAEEQGRAPVSFQFLWDELGIERN